MTLTSTTTDITISSSTLDDLVAGTYLNVLITLTAADSTSYTYLITAPDVTVNPADDSYTLTSASLSLATFPSSYYRITLQGDSTSTIHDSGCTLIDPDLLCQVYEQVKLNVKRPNQSITDFHIKYDTIINTQSCDSCDCQTSQQIYLTLKRDIEDSSYQHTNDCGCT